MEPSEVPPLLDAIARRRSPRAWAPAEPSEATLVSLFEAARWAPSCFNEQPWTYLVTRRSDGAPFEDALAGLTPGNQAWAKSAPVLCFSLVRERFARNDKPNRHAWHDVGAASALLSIQAASLGLMVHQMAGIVREVVRERFAVPDELEIVAALAIGYPGDPDQLDDALRERELAPRTRKPLAEVFARRSLT
jgi:nitroreductase